MTNKATKAKRKAIPTFTLAELDRQKGTEENYDHLLDPLDKWLLAEKRKAECEELAGASGPVYEADQMDIL